MSLPHTIHGVETEPYNIYSTAQRWIPGQRMELPDGRIYRGALEAGNGLESCNMTEAEVEATFVTLAIQTALVAGDTAIKLTNATTFLALNEAKGGYVTVWLAGPPPTNSQTFRIWSNNKTVSGGVTTATLVLWPGLKVKEAISTSGKGSIALNPWRNIIVAPTTAPTGFATGVTLVDVTASYYCWLQTRGVCGVVVDDGETLDPGDGITMNSTLDAGSIENQDPVASALLGHAINDGASDDIGFVFLLID